MFATDALNLLVTQLQQATAAITPVPLVEIGWPQMPKLTNRVAKGGGSAISIYDAGHARDASRFMLYAANEVVTPPGLTSKCSVPTLAPGNTATVTLGGTPLQNDAVSVVVGADGGVFAAVASAVAGETLSTLAARVADEANTVLSAWITASANASVVTVQNISQDRIALNSNVGNIGTRYTETHREIRDVQVDVWTASVPQRVAIGRLVDQQLAYLDAHFGVRGVGGSVDDGTWVRIRHLGDQFVDTDVLLGLYRWMWHVSVEYGQTYPQALYSVLAFMPSQGSG